MTLTDLITQATAKRRRWACGPLALEATPVGPPGKPFLRRLALCVGRARVMLHLHEGADPRPAHSHPLAMLSLILRGGYDEYRPGECRTRGAGRWNWIPSAVHHRIVPFQGGALTLVFGWMRRDGRWAFFDGAREIPHDSAEGKALIFVK